MNTILFIPVSIGEAFDKLSILDIKIQYINDERKINVEKEYALLYNEIKVYVNNYLELYESMKKINLLIWNQMDLLRDGTITNEKYMILCKECIDTNDIRFRIKNKINLITDSTIREQKSYKCNRIVLFINCNEIILPLFINPIKYLSYIYDEIIINYTMNIELLKNKLNYDNTIKFNNDSVDVLNIKKKLLFEDKEYNIHQIYDIMNINEELIKQYIFY